MSDPLDPADTTDDATADEGAGATPDQGVTVESAGGTLDQAAEPATDPVAEPRLDLDGIERDLADVELALARLDSGEYWTDEVTGAAIPDDHLAEHPTARRLADR